MICPHCGKEVYSSMNNATPLYSNLNAANAGCNPVLTTWIPNAANANPLPAHVTLYSTANVAGCNPFPQVTYITF